LERLPETILGIIVFSFPVLSVLRTSESCRTFRDVALADDVWEQHLNRNFLHYVPNPSSNSSHYAEYKQQWIKKHTRTDADIKQAVKECCKDPVAGRLKYGEMRDWIVDEVTDMRNLFARTRNFDEKIQSGM
jgi:hypothetical protein